MALMLQKTLAFPSHIFTIVPIFFCKKWLVPRPSPFYPSPRRAKSIPSPRAIFVVTPIFEAFFPPLEKSRCPCVCVCGHFVPGGSPLMEGGGVVP